MNIIQNRRCARGLAAVLLSAGLVPVVARASTNQPVAASIAAAARTNAVPVPTVIPKSIFIMPTKPEEGIDPFFPNSMRVYTAGIIRTNHVSVVSAAARELRLKGISGSPGQWLAIVNNHTFAAGEQCELATTAGRVLVQCVAISADHATVQIGSERFELQLQGKP